MVNNVIHATYTETYDLKTVAGKMGIIGVHTPTSSALKKMFKGFFEQYKKVKINSVDIAGVCASAQSLTPGEIGLTEGLTDPRDVLNPILFKACTGENLNLLLDRIYGTTGSDFGSMHRIETADTDDINAYYTMLADDSFRKFHPQGGVRVSDLKPFVHHVTTTQPFKWQNAYAPNPSPRIGNSGNQGANTVDGSIQATGFGGSNGDTGANPSIFVTAGLEPMPWLETTYESTITDISQTPEATVPATVLASSIPKCYCGVFILPPCILQPLYFRWSFMWHISFKDFRPAYEIGPIGTAVVEEDAGGMNGNYSTYYNLYNQNKLLDTDLGSFDANGTESADVIMEKGY